jgi:hypothetical protein
VPRITLRTCVAPFCCLSSDVYSSGGVFWQGQVLIFYAVRMFREACATRRLDVLQFLLLNGFDLQQSYMRDVLHGVLEGIEGPQRAETVQPLIRFLLDAGVDVNWQRKSDLYTALHVACCKNLYPIAYLLVLYGADVNAIAAVDFAFSSKRPQLLEHC